jgi:microsomal dipeptidase-like Zn-dependent dipeptidase
MHFTQPEVLPEVTETLLGQGYSDEDVRAVLGENFLLVAGQIRQLGIEHYFGGWGYLC